MAYLMLYGNGWSQRWGMPSGSEEQVRSQAWTKSVIEGKLSRKAACGLLDDDEVVAAAARGR